MFQVIPPRVVDKLGADHVAWLLSQPYPSGVCKSRMRGQWDINDAEGMAVYAVLGDIVDGRPLVAAPGWTAVWYAYFAGLSDRMGLGWGENSFWIDGREVYASEL